MNLETVQNQLKEQKYFINRIAINEDHITETLCKKINDSKFEVVDKVMTPSGEMSAEKVLLSQINNQIVLPELPVCSLNDVLPVIDGVVFDDYKRREKQIEKHIKWCQCVETEENELSSGRYVVKWKKLKHTIYAIVYDDSLTEINGALLDDKHKESAVQIKYPKLLLKALRDNLDNEFEEGYIQEAKKYQAI